MRQPGRIVLVFLAAWLAFGSPAGAQPTPTPDSLLGALRRATADTTRVQLLLDVTAAYTPADPVRAQAYAERALALAQRAPLPQLLPAAYIALGRTLHGQRKMPEAQRCFVQARDLALRLQLLKPLAQSYRRLGVLGIEQNRPADALKQFKQALTVQLRLSDTQETLRAYSNVGFCYQQQGQYALALQAYLAGMKLGEKYNDAPLASQYVNLLGNLSSLYGTQSDPETAIRYLQRAQVVLSRFPDPAAELSILSILGGCYYNTSRDTLALSSLNKVLRLARQLGGAAPSRAVASTLFYLGGIAVRRHEYPLALRYLNRAATQTEQTGHNDLRVFVLNMMANAYSQQGHFEQAFAVARQALGIAQQAGYAQQIVDSYTTLAQTSAAAGHHAAAYGYQKKFQELNDSLFNEAKSKELANLATQYQMKQKETQISLLQRNTALQRRARNVLVGALVAVALMGGGTYRRYRLERRARRLLQAKELELAARNQALMDAEQCLHRSLDEKEVLLKEVHHRVKNNLQVIASRLALQALEQRANPAVTAALRDGQNWVKSISLIHEMLYQSDDLTSVEFQPFLEQLVAQLGRAFAGGGAGAVSCAVHAPGVRLGTSTAVPLGLVINELLSNAYKHAFAGGRNGHVDIYLAAEADGFCLRVCDDGAGLPAGFSLDTTVSLGLRLVRSLARQLEGRIGAAGRPAAGTEFCLTFRNIDEPGPMAA